MFGLKKVIFSLIICSMCVFSFSGVQEAEAAEPSLAQCQGEPSKGTGWGTFWMVIGGLNAVGGSMMVGSPDTYEDIYDNPRTVGIASMIVGGGLMGLGIGMRSSANKYNEACANLLSYKNLERGFELEPIAQKATGMRLVYRW